MGSALRSVLGSGRSARRCALCRTAAAIAAPAFCRHTYVTQGSVHDGRRSLRSEADARALRPARDRRDRACRIEHPSRSPGGLRGLARAPRSRRHRYRLRAAPQRFRATRRTLATRTAVAVVPADEFDPKAEAVQRFAAELARSDRSLRGWFDRRARALRVRLTNDRKGPPRLSARSPGPLARAAARRRCATTRVSSCAKSPSTACAAGAGRPAADRAGARPPEHRTAGPARSRPRSAPALRRGDGLAEGRARRAGQRLRRPAADRRTAPRSPAGKA